MPRQQRAQATVDAILEGAAHILLELGYEGLTTNRIAKKAGVSVGSLYQYFPNKQAILVAMVQRHYREQMELFAQNLENLPGESVAGDVRVLLRLCLEAEREQRQLLEVFMTQVPDVGQSQAMREGLEEIVSMVEAKLLQVKPSLSDPKARRAAAQALTFAVHRVIAEAVAADGELSTEQLMGTLDAMVLGIVGSPDSP